MQLCSKANNIVEEIAPVLMFSLEQLKVVSAREDAFPAGQPGSPHPRPT